MAPLRRIGSRVKRTLRHMLSRRVPARLARNFLPLPPQRRQELLDSIKSNYLTGWRDTQHYAPSYVEYLVADHLHTGLDGDRITVIPWLDRVRRLDGLRVLDIGCGTGSSTVALAEQGAKVTAIDIDGGALQVASDRCRIYGIDATLRLMNANAIAAFGANAFDLVIFSGSLEHMTNAERLAGLGGAWAILPAGGLLSVVDAPNRLWYFDGHTSQLPFYNWLPNDLAFDYSRFSTRKNFCELYKARDGTTEEHFLRRGRGVSFHEFDLAVKPARELKVVGAMNSGWVEGLFASSERRRYKAMLRSLCPGVHQGFFDPTLELVIERD
jgi:2-polyprenyl-3-methyl-5-hydroxy-6-metoxy-1,4-benzoquinol methylase